MLSLPNAHLNPAPSVRSRTSRRRWSRFSETESAWSQDDSGHYGPPDDAGSEDLGDLMLNTQQALNILRNEQDDDSCFNFDDPDASVYSDDDEGSEVGRSISRRPSTRNSGIRPPYTSTATVPRLPSIRRPSTLGGPSRKLGGLTRPRASLDRGASMLRRALSNRRGSAQVYGLGQKGAHPLARTVQVATEPESDTDFEASIARLSASTLLQADKNTSAHSLALVLPGYEEPAVPSAQKSSETLRNDDPRDQPACPGDTKQKDAALFADHQACSAEQQSPVMTVPATPATVHTVDPEKKGGCPSPSTVEISSIGSEKHGSPRPTTSSSGLPPPPSPPGAAAAPELAVAPEATDGVVDQGSRIAIIGLALSLSVFLVGLDVNIIATAVPRITTEFNSQADVAWYGSVFLITSTAFQIPFGRLYTLYSAKWVFVAVISIFMLGSVVTATAPSSIAFIIGRAIQGIGASGVLSGALVIAARSVPLSKRALLGGIIGAMEGVAMISAPIIGGYFTDRLTWRWCFYINLPIGAVVVAVIVFVLRLPPAPPQENPGMAAMAAAFAENPTLLKRVRLMAIQLDAVGSALLMTSIITLLLALQWGGTKYPWSSASIILLFVLTAVLLGIFAHTQRQKQDMAMVSPRILRKRTVLAGFWFMLCVSSSLVVISYLLPQWFQSALGVSPENSGIRMLPILISVIVGVLLSGVAVTLIGYYAPFMILGTVLMSVGAGLLSTITPSTSSGLLIAFPAIFGAGAGIAFQQPIVAAQTVLAPADVPMGTSVIVFGQGLGGAIVLSIAESVFYNRLAPLVRDAVGMDVDASVLLSGSPQDLADRFIKAGGTLAQLADIESRAITQAIYVAVAVSALSIFGALTIEWKNIKKEEARRKAEEAALKPTT